MMERQQRTSGGGQIDDAGGELKGLELAWQEAERVAAIADDLLVPVGTDEFLERHRAPPQS